MRTVTALLLASLAAPAGAQSLMPGPSAAGRYEMQPVEGGIARLDTVTGEVTLCRVEAGALRCRPSEVGAPPVVATGPATPDAAEEDAEFDKALGRMKRVFRAFHDIAREFDGERVPPASNEAGPDRT